MTISIPLLIACLGSWLIIEAIHPFIHSHIISVYRTRVSVPGSLWITVSSLSDFWAFSRHLFLHSNSFSRLPQTWDWKKEQTMVNQFIMIHVFLKSKLIILTWLIFHLFWCGCNIFFHLFLFFFEHFASPFSFGNAFQELLTDTFLFILWL